MPFSSRSGMLFVMLTLVLLLSACGGDENSSDGDSDVDGSPSEIDEGLPDGDLEDADGDSDTDMDASADGDDAEEEEFADGDAEEMEDLEEEDEALSEKDVEVESEWDEPALEGEIRSCTPSAGSEDVFLFKGTVVTPDEAWLNGEVLTDRQSGEILCAAEDCSGHEDYAAASVFCAEGVILPGMLDPHNHSWYNTIPRWKHPGNLGCRYDCDPETDADCTCRRLGGMYETRHDWPDDEDYQNQLKAYYNGLKDDHECAMQKWAEARMMIHGTTGVAGACQMRRCFNHMVRNLDLATSYSGLDADRMQTNIYEIRTITNDADQVGNYCGRFESGDTTALLLHLAEGVVEDHNRTEFHDLSMPDDTRPNLTMLTPQLVGIHSTGGYTEELTLMACGGSKLVWSPRSNIDLYGQTTNIPTALNLGVQVSLGPDWTPSGSLSQLQEMRCASFVSETYWDGLLSSKDLVGMVTREAAASMAIEDRIGSLETGKLADLSIVAADEDGRRRPYGTILQARAWDIRLTLIGGEPVYGDADFVPYNEFCEPLDVCGHAKMLCVKASESTDDQKNQTLADILTELDTALTPLREAAADEDKYLFEVLPLFFCPGSDEYEADQAENVCTFKHNPQPAVLYPAVPETPVDDDPDQDGIASDTDNCPRINNADQMDRNDNGIGDACELASLEPADCPRRAGIGCNLAESGGKSNTKRHEAHRPERPAPPTRRIAELQGNGKWRMPEGARTLVPSIQVTALAADGFYAQDDSASMRAGVRVRMASRPLIVEPGRWFDLYAVVRYEGLQLVLEAERLDLADFCALTIPDDPAPASLNASSRPADYLGMRIRMESVETARNLGIGVSARVRPGGRPDLRISVFGSSWETNGFLSGILVQTAEGFMLVAED